MMNRQIVLDTETTGLEARQGHRIIEIGAVELVERKLTGQKIHFYLNPDRDSDEEAFRVHGLSTAFLADKPRFHEVAAPLLEFLSGAELLIHNASFDVGFLNAEFSRLDPDFKLENHAKIVDTLHLAKKLYPGKKNSLDALCARFKIDTTDRVLHGALLDAQLLADAYLAMTRGQNALEIQLDEHPLSSSSDVFSLQPAQKRHLKVLSATQEEEAAHQIYLTQLGKNCASGALWCKIAG